MKIDLISFKIFGQPTKLDIDKTILGYNRIFTVILTATDPVGAFATTKFTINVSKLLPVKEGDVKNILLHSGSQIFEILPRYTSSGITQI